MKTITLAHGNGGQENNELIEGVFYKHLKNEYLVKSEDACIIEDGKLAFTTDSFTISPLFFNGGDIGKLSICGTCNDLAMMGAKPTYVTLAMMIEEGFEFKNLEKIVRSIKKELENNGAKVVAGDTKVVPRGSVDGLFINTSAVGIVKQQGISASNLEDGDVIVVSRDIGRHGATIYAAREGIDIQSDLKSDCVSLWPMIEALFEAGIKPKEIRDATRGGLAAVLNEWAKASDVCIEIQEDKIPVCDEVNGICELLGFEPSALANEGTFVLVLDKKDVDKTLEILKTFENNKMACEIGKVGGEHKKKVLLFSQWGTKRFLDMPTGELLPRIC
ncbi:hydrogenase expression/formation protein HypE [Sulfurospirillum sp. 1307]|jgi:hydrogenase expression/formation protein HypE